MSVCSAHRRVAQRILTRFDVQVAELPAFLLPRLLRPAPYQSFRPYGERRTTRRAYSTVTDQKLESSVKVPAFVLQKLPRQCPGCGAHTQFVDKEEAGFYTTTRGTIKAFLGNTAARDNSAEEIIVQAALKNAGAAAEGLSFDRVSSKSKPNEPPFCDRCHDIMHHSNGVSIHHPKVSAIQDTILESPHSHNHIYHIIDAADFPMSLIPQLQKLLHATPQRSHNRRSKTDRYYQGKKIDMSFIITRSDLLAATKEQVDALMPYLRETLRDALGRAGKDVRLGNVKCVSATRQWWTSGLKEDIFKRGGANWMVGKVNVGKSQLLHEIFPKGRREVGGPSGGYKKIALVERVEVVAPSEEAHLSGGDGTLEAIDSSITEDHATVSGAAQLQDISASNAPLSSLGDQNPTTTDYLDSSSLLPPAPPEVDYPAMPLVSSLPGTTASPIRLPFGSGKGEMIDLPGLSRGELELYVKPEHRPELVMRSRITPEQHTLKPGHSLLLGGFIRITSTSHVDILSYNFTPLSEHRTSTIKAIEIQAQSEEAKNVPSIALPAAVEKTKLAGTFHIKWDVTKERAGPLTHSNKVGLKPEKLAFKVLATDLLIEGVGWVELVAQVRRRPGLPSSDQLVQEHDTTNSRGLKSTTNPDIRVESTSEQSKADILHKGKPVAEETVRYSPLGGAIGGSSISSEYVDSVVEENAVQMTTEDKHPSEDIDPTWPTFEVYTPEGKFVTTRRPMNAWLNVLSKPKKAGVRPRRSMKGRKKAEKKLRRGW